MSRQCKRIAYDSGRSGFQICEKLPCFGGFLPKSFSTNLLFSFAVFSKVEWMENQTGKTVSTFLRNSISFVDKKTSYQLVKITMTLSLALQTHVTVLAQI